MKSTWILVAKLVAWSLLLAGCSASDNNGEATAVPTPNVSLVDLVATLEKETTKEEANNALKKASETSLKGILAYTEEPLVSCDFNGSHFSSIVDASNTTIIDGDMIKVLAWYDNENGYANRMVDLVLYLAKKL